MGSHGGGTAEGQMNVLRNWELMKKTWVVRFVLLWKPWTTDLFLQASIVILMKTLLIQMGLYSSTGSRHIPVSLGISKAARQADCRRFGKVRGARAVHLTGPRGLEVVLPKLAEKALHHAPISAGLA